ncbi:MAG: hypothetical protein LBJ00_03645 [Planctomycetaceae bacterium]|nr:hypothetical protein [Planctomycetaceae bacterium]
MNTLTWASVEKAIFYSDRSSITKIDLDGKKTKFYIPKILSYTQAVLKFLKLNTQA